MNNFDEYINGLIEGFPARDHVREAPRAKAKRKAKRRAMAKVIVEEIVLLIITVIAMLFILNIDGIVDIMFNGF